MDNLSQADMTGCHLLLFKPHPWHLPSQFFPSALQLPHQIWSQAKPFQPPLLRNCESTAQKVPVCLQISFHSKYFTQRVTRSTVGFAGVCFGANEVLVVAGYFREEGTNMWLQMPPAKKVWACLFHVFSRGSDARDIFPLQYSPDSCLTGENKFQAVWGWVKPCFVLYLACSWNLLAALLSRSS